MSRHKVKVDVHTGDALDIQTDLLVLKNSEGADGVGKAVARKLNIGIGGWANWDELPDVGEWRTFDCDSSIQARNVLYLGVKPVPHFGYQDIRRFARRSLEIAKREFPRIEHVTLTLHGPGYGLDEREAFESELAGLMEAIREGAAPEELTRISFVEINPKRADRLESILAEFLPGGVIESGNQASEQARSVGYDSETKPRVFVAMPFAEEFEDVYHLGIQDAVNSAGMLCERIDEAAFTGNVTKQIKNRIESASLVIADVTDANPNVYLEVGYAWGEDIPTLFITQDTADLEFDIQHHNSIIYDRNSIRKLKDELTNSLSELDPTLDESIGNL